MSISDEQIRATVLFKLIRNAKWLHSHTSMDNLSKSFPKDVRGRVKENVEKLIKDGYLLVKPTSYGKEVSLNVRKKQEIEEFVATYLK